MCTKHKCKFCGKEISFDKKHGYYHIFCSRNCQLEYNLKNSLYSEIHYCIFCGNPSKYDEKLKRWRKTCCSPECLKKAQRIAQHCGVKNRIKIKIDKDELYDLFIIQNKSRAEVSKYFKCSEANIKKICKTYGIVKNQKDALKNTYNTKLEKYGNAYYTNNDIISVAETTWLNKVGVPNDLNHRQVVLGEYRVDGFIPETNTIYEFLGDYWHGNPKLFAKNEFNKHNEISMGELYRKTFERFDNLKNMGYNINYIWESDFNKGKDFLVYG